MKKFNKITTGFVIQEYQQIGKKYVCVHQAFEAGDPVEYEDADGEPIMIDTSQEQYEPFDLKQPRPVITNALKFVCPSCKGDRLECVMDGSHTCEVLNVEPNGDFDYDDYQSDGDLDRWQCLNCGYVIKEDKIFAEPIIDNLEIVEWIKEHCSQE